jgi:uncharacterized protein YaaQ
MNDDQKESLFLAIVQSQDVDMAVQLLSEINVDIYKLPSVGGFLGRKNATLLIRTLPENRDKVLELLRKSCQQRIEYIAIPLESASMPLPTPTPITVGGAIIFDLEIEHYEEL